MPNNKSPKISNNFLCEICNYKCSKKSEYNKHLNTAKHNRLINPSMPSPKISDKFGCKCGKTYKHLSSLCSHKKTCSVFIENEEILSEDTTQKSAEEVGVVKRDELIEQLVSSNTEMKTLMMAMMTNYQESQIQNRETTKEIIKETTRQNQENTKELVNKVIDVMPQIGNTTNNNTNNHTLNFYLTDTCKDAESIHDFTDRFIVRIVDFFKKNYRDIAYKRISLPDNVRDIFFECLDENPQTHNFVQTTDVKNGVFYVKEKKKNKESQFYGEAEFVKYRDGFEKSGVRLGHAINCALLPCKTECLPILERDFKAKPNEEDYDEEDEEEYQKDKDTYYNTTRTIQDNLMFQTINAMNIFDSKQVRDSTLSKTKRSKNGV